MAEIKNSKITPMLVALAMTAGFAAGSQATVIATISGQYSFPVGDTPSLFFHNPSVFDFTNVQLGAQAYNGINALLPVGTDINKSDNIGGPFHRTQIKNLPNIVSMSDVTYTFLDGPAACGPGFTNEGDLFATDYDDTYGCSPAAQPGNVQFTFTALWNGQPIFSVFSPDSNATGGFVGFLGLDQGGFAETSFDAGGAASGTGDSGLLAEIQIGTPPGVPEPATLSLVGIGLIGLAGRQASRKR